MIIKTVALDNVLLNDETFVFSFPKNDAQLIDSIDKVGLLQPVCLREHSHGLQIVYGAKRILACKQLGLKEIPARVFSKKECSDQQALEYSLAEDVPFRELNPIEKSCVLSKFQSIANWSVPQLVSELTPQLNLPKSTVVVNDYLKMLLLEDDIRLEIAEGKISPGHAFLLTDLDPDSRQVIYQKIFLECRASLSEAREIVESLLDLKVILKQSISEILQIPAIAQILDSSEKARTKCQFLRTELKKQRYPRLSQLEKTFKAKVNSLSLHKNVQLKHAPFFEQNHLDFTVRAKNSKELKQALIDLSEAAENGRVTELFEIVKGSA